MLVFFVALVICAQGSAFIPAESSFLVLSCSRFGRDGSISSFPNGGTSSSTTKQGLRLVSRSIPENSFQKNRANSQQGSNATLPRAGDRKSRLDYNVEISTLGNSGQWKAALAVLEKMAADGCQPNVVTYNSVMSVLVKNGQWNQTLQVFDMLRTSKLAADTRSYSVAISACSKGRKWQKALEFLGEMEAAGVKPNEFTYRPVDYFSGPDLPC